MPNGIGNYFYGGKIMLIKVKTAKRTFTGQFIDFKGTKACFLNIETGREEGIDPKDIVEMTPLSSESSYKGLVPLILGLGIGITIFWLKTHFGV